MNGISRQETETLAMEYVLGALSPEEALTIERQLADDDALAAYVRHLREHLLELDFSAPADQASDTLWAAIEGRLDDKVVALADQRPASRPPAPGRPGYWRGFVTAAIAATVLFAAATGAFLQYGPKPEPQVIAVLVDADANPGVILEALAGNRVRIVPLVDIPVPEGRALEIWTKPDPAGGPVSLGLMQAANEASLGGFDLPNPDAEQLYEISLEPATGSPVGRPTGPVLFKGYAKIPR